MFGFIFLPGTQAELAAIAAVLCVVCVSGAVFARTRAPAVSVALVTGLTTGVIAFIVSWRGSPHGVPLVVLMSASVGLTASGLLALWFLPAQARAGSLRRAAAVIAAAAPLVGLMTLVSIQHACPLYVTRGWGFCHYDDDVLGGWSAAAAVIISLDMLVIALLVWLTAARPSHIDIDVDENSDMLVRPSA